MTPELKILMRKTFIGIHRTMSLANNETEALWKSFMPRRSEIIGGTGDELYDILEYPPGYFVQFDPAAEFKKWAAVEVGDASKSPSGFTELVVEPGTYAVFIHHGPISAAPRTFQYIFTNWLPRSGFTIDDRPHINVMGKKYSLHGEDSEEELWIPVKPKTHT